MKIFLYYPLNRVGFKAQFFGKSLVENFYVLLDLCLKDERLLIPILKENGTNKKVYLHNFFLNIATSIYFR
ncbi:hypothetical protein D5R40_17275 [Okeania hirsuta]|uniref:Uncharacterized protein n=1 Tax=Okeania hirsuta TaxID=1458930 RepID=A0A3N6PAX6_9CYAN|nr:hypothetical protein D5R40_17275 [Okeania hirsuta]